MDYEEDIGVFMSEYDDDAERLQSMTRNDEINHPQEYHPIQVRQAVVHGREDIVLLVSYLQSANKQLTSIRRLLFILILLISSLVWHFLY